MKWVVLAIVVMIVPFTYLSLRYRKEAPPFRPYEDMKDRANTTRLLSAGYQRIPLPARRPADPLKSPRSTFIATVDGGLPAELKTTLVDTPLLPAQITNVAAPGEIAANADYAFRFACTMSDFKRELAGADLYVKGDQLVITPDYDKLSGQFMARSTENIVELIVPAGALKRGHYRVTLVGEKSSRAWSLDVK